MADFQTIILEQENDIGIVTLNRPERFNAINQKLSEELISLIESLNENEKIRALIITGAGEAFCSGGDFSKQSQLEWASELSSGETFMSGYRETVPKIMCGLQALNVPTIAALNGMAVGLGCDLALACDIRIACEHTKLAAIWIKRGLIPAAGGFWMLPRIVGVGRAAEIIFSGRFVEAEEGERIGLFNKVVPSPSLRSEAIALAQTFTQNPPIGLKCAKMMLYRGLSLDYRSGIELAGAVQAVAHTTEDHAEAINAWRERRKPVFKGR
jgi:2-(1,2-epoxy-1,2-dihydrophenyl)acetyl-CoA isomerase